ncbi:MAG: glycosyltransferase family 2 protein [Bryobacteraceae bacterium]
MRETASPPHSAVQTPRYIFPYGLSVFFPAYNDAPSLPALINKTFAVLDQSAREFEVIVVNDGSADDTGAVLEALRNVHGPRLRVITHPENRGYGGALRTGFAAAAKEFVFYTDGDGQYDVGELPSLLEAVWPDVGLINGYKTRRRDPLRRVVIGAVYNQFARLLFGVKLRDIDCDFRLIRRSLLERAKLHSSSGAICVELVKMLEASGMRVVEVPVSHYPRRHGRSQFFRVKSLATTFAQLFRLYVHLMHGVDSPASGERK